MNGPIAEIFSQHLPSLPKYTAKQFAHGMQSYHTEFRRIHDVAMNYQSLPEYLNMQHAIMRVQKDQFWPYTPHFRKIVAAAIQLVFKTKIVALSASLIPTEQILVFIDEHSNRWTVTVEESVLDTDYNRIYIYFPRSNTPTGFATTPIPVKTLNDPAFANSGSALYMHDVTAWGV